LSSNALKYGKPMKFYGFGLALSEKYGKNWLYEVSTAMHIKNSILLFINIWFIWFRVKRKYGPSNKMRCLKSYMKKMESKTGALLRNPWVHSTICLKRVPNSVVKGKIFFNSDTKIISILRPQRSSGASMSKWCSSITIIRLVTSGL